MIITYNTEYNLSFRMSYIKRADSEDVVLERFRESEYVLKNAKHQKESDEPE